MTIDDAIIILNNYNPKMPCLNPSVVCTALKLGIEALKMVKNARNDTENVVHDFLKGEDRC